jgi:RNA polymerase sigma factor (sigma-70 family)
MKILIVDDEPTLVAGLELLLQSHDFHAVGASNREAAEEKLARDFFPVVLADVRLRTEADGMQLIDAVRRLSPESRIASMSGYLDAATEQRLRERGADIVLQKPFVEEELIAALREMVALVERSEASSANDEELYASTVGMLHAISRRRYGFDAADAEDLVQETWLLFLQKRASIRTPRAWLTGAIANLCRQRIDRLQRERARSGELVDHGSAPSYESSLTVRQGLERLDERSRSLCTMLGLEERTYEDVSTALDIPIGSIGPLYLRAKQRLRQAVVH